MANLDDVEMQDNLQKKQHSWKSRCCPCCFGPHSFCNPCQITLVGSLGCCCWTLCVAAVLIGLWLILTFTVIKGQVCDQIDAQMYPDDGWLNHTASQTPSRWQFTGSQADGCLQWRDGINVTDWFVDEADWKEVFFPSGDGLQLHGFWFPGRNGSGSGVGEANSAPTIIQVHGHGPYAAQQSQMIPAKTMQERGFNVLIFNNRGLGKSEKPPSTQGIRTFGADELADTQGAIKLVTENADGVLPYATPLAKVGIFTESGGNGMVWFFRKDIPGAIMQESIYDWVVRFERDAGALGALPLLTTLIEQCVSEKTAGASIFEENYKDQLDRNVFDPHGRKVLLMHNRADEYNLFANHAEPWERDLKAKGFTVQTYFPEERAPDSEDCNQHVTLTWGPTRKAALQKMCEHWQSVFNVSATCGDVATFDRFVV